jgi:hypothetical protein
MGWCTNWWIHKSILTIISNKWKRYNWHQSKSHLVILDFIHRKRVSHFAFIITWPLCLVNIFSQQSNTLKLYDSHHNPHTHTPNLSFTHSLKHSSPTQSPTHPVTGSTVSVNTFLHYMIVLESRNEHPLMGRMLQGSIVTLTACIWSRALGTSAPPSRSTSTAAVCPHRRITTQRERTGRLPPAEATSRTPS